VTFYICVFLAALSVLLDLPHMSAWVAIFLTLGSVTVLAQAVLMAASAVARSFALTALIASPNDQGSEGEEHGR